MHLKIQELTIARLRSAFEQAEQTCGLQLGKEEMDRLVDILFQDGHQSSHELYAFPDLYAFVCARLKRWGYIREVDPQKPGHL